MQEFQFLWNIFLFTNIMSRMNLIFNWIFDEIEIPYLITNKVQHLLSIQLLFFIFFCELFAPLAILYWEMALLEFRSSALWILIKSFNIYTLYDYIYLTTYIVYIHIYQIRHAYVYIYKSVCAHVSIHAYINTQTQYDCFNFALGLA